MIVAEAALFGLAVAFMCVGLLGIVVPVLPGTVLIWLSVLAYGVLERFEAIDWLSLAVISLIALVTGTADIWLSLVGARSGGASRRSLLLGFLGSVVGFLLLGAFLPIVGNLLGALIGYSFGVLLGQYHKHRDWNVAFRASLGGLVGWGLATAVQLGGGLLMILIFVWQVLSFS